MQGREMTKNTSPVLPFMMIRVSCLQGNDRVFLSETEQTRDKATKTQQAREETVKQMFVLEYFAFKGSTGVDKPENNRERESDTRYRERKRKRSPIGVEIERERELELRVRVRVGQAGE
jgi:hypothetical protein